MVDGCRHHDAHAGLAPSALEAALDEAERACRLDGERMTEPRRRVLELLLQAGEPVKAYDLIGRYGRDGQAAKPPTVYRALEFLERRGLAHRIASLAAYVACAHEAGAHAAAFLICDCCGEAREFEPPTGSGLSAAAAELGYAVNRITIEAHGHCAACREV